MTKQQTKSPSMPYYFAYGSNLDLETWTRFCQQHQAIPEDLVPVGTGWLPDMRLAFHYRSGTWGGGALDIVHAPGFAVPGVLFRLTAKVGQLLDKKEGAPAFYQRIYTTALNEAHAPVDVVTYKLVEWRVGDFVAPSTAYYDACQRGLQRFGLPLDALQEAASHHKPRPFPRQLFAYGSLMQGGEFHPTLQPFGPHNIRRMKLQGRLYGKGRPYPMLRSARTADDWVWGEVIEPQDLPSLLQQCDEIEEFLGYREGQSPYHRVIQKVFTPEGLFDSYAWCYLYAQEIAEESRIISGDWRRGAG